MSNLPSANKRTIRINVNDSEYERTIEPRLTLADFIREELGLTGTHLGCEHGICGACTILFDGQPVRSCILFAVQADGHTIQTVESLAKDGELHPLQRAFWENSALQCGFCTPGFLLTALNFLERNPQPTELEVREALSGNLCRCTGYQSIIAAVLAAADKVTS
jgi:carbon-monoxide dehydrogenase small subunit